MDPTMTHVLPLAALGLWLCLAASATAADRLSIEAVSVKPDGRTSDWRSYGSSTTRDGRIVAFGSNSSVVANPDPRGGTLFLRDRISRTTTQVPQPGPEWGTGGMQHSPLISAQGNYLAFVWGPDNSHPLLVGRDLVTGNEQVFGYRCTPVALTPDGRFLLYADQMAEPGLHVVDRSTGAETHLAFSIDQGAPVWIGGGITSDGRYVTYATNQPVGGVVRGRIWIHDRATGTSSILRELEQMPRALAATPDGRFVAFEHQGRLLPGDTEFSFGVHVLDRQSGAIARIGGDNALWSRELTISDDGRWVLFTADTPMGMHVVRGDRLTGSTLRITTRPDGTSGGGWGGRISADGQTITFTSEDEQLVTPDGNSYVDVFVARVDSSTPYQGSPRPVPGRLAARDYDAGGAGVAYLDADARNSGGQYRPDEGVDLSTSTAAGSIYLAATATGEWLKYTVTVAQAGQYRLTARVATPSTTASFTLESGLVYLTPRLPVPTTGGFQTWRVVDFGTVTLAAEQQTLRLAITGAFNLDWLQLDAVSPPTTAVRINFQPAGAAVVPGYLPDSGAVFATRNGRAYGWNAPTETRERNAHADQRLDTLAMMQAASNRTAVWEIALPNGTYRVRAVCGDPSFADGRFDLRAEGTLAVRGQSTTAAPFVEGTVTVTVADGRLTLSNGPDSYNTKLCYVEIDGGDTTPPPPPPGFAARINFQPAGAAVPAGYLPDAGATFAARNGLTYGWNVAVPTRERNAVTDQRVDTLALSQSGGANATWELAVPNGTYDVRVVCGDPSFFDGSFRVLVEGTLAVNGTASSATPFREGTVRVTVTDGRVTISNGAGSYNTKLCYVEVAQVPTGAG